MNSQAQFLTERLLLSTYPLTRGIIEQIEKNTSVVQSKAICLGELKRNSPLAIFKELRKLGSKDLEVWVIVSDHNYQPYLQIMLLLASIIKSGKYFVCDYSGEKYNISRLNIWLTTPWKLLLGSVNGLWALCTADKATKRLMKECRITDLQLTDLSRVMYLKTNLWFGVQAGGSIGHVAGVVNGFSRMGITIDVYTAESLQLLDDEVQVTMVPINASGGIPLELNGYIFQRVFDRYITSLQNKYPVDLVYQRNCLVNYSGVLMSRRLQVPLVIEYNGSEVWVSKNWGVPLRFSRTAQRIEDVNLRHAHLIVVVSDVLRDELLERGIDEDRILFYPNCIDPRIFNPDNFSTRHKVELRSRWNISQEALVCTFVGTFGPWHGVDVLAGSVRQLVENRLDWLREQKIHFLFVGDGQLMPKVRELLSEVPEDIYTFTGLVAQSDAPLYLAISNVLLSPHVPNPDGSRFFGSPTKLFEYMAMGKPIIASELEQIGEVLQGSWHIGRQGMPEQDQNLSGSTALLTTPGEINELCDALQFLVEHPASRTMIGNAARTLALSKFTWEQQVKEIMHRLQKLDMKSN